MTLTGVTNAEGEGLSKRGKVTRREVLAASAIALVGSLSPRMYAAFTHDPVTTPDSAYYRYPDFSGRGRLPVTGAFYGLFETDGHRVVAQSLVAGLAWGFLAVVAASTARTRSGRFTAGGLVVLLGLMSRFTRWDLVIYSESINLSVTAALLALSILMGRRPRPVFAIPLLVMLVMFFFTRESNLSLAMLVPALLVACSPGSLRKMLVPLVSVAIVTLLTAVSVLSFTSRNEYGVALQPEAQERFGAESIGIGEMNFTGVYLHRLLGKQEWEQWFLDRGMPTMSDAAIRAWQADPHTPMIFSEKRFFDWARREGTRTYILFLVTHPGYTLLEPFRNGETFFRVLAPKTGSDGSNLSVLDPGPEFLPLPLNFILGLGIEPQAVLPICLVVLLALVGASAALARRELLVPVSLMVSALIHAILVWHGSQGESERHGVVAFQLLLIGVWLGAVLLGEAAVEWRRRGLAR